MKTIIRYKSIVYLLLLLTTKNLYAQEPVIRGVGRGNLNSRLTNANGNTPTNGRNKTPGGADSTGKSSVERRDYSDDSLRVKIYYLSAIRPVTFDTSIRDYTSRFPIPSTHVFLGNTGSATRSLLFSTPVRIGWDPGFHSLDVYKWKVEDVRFFNTPKAYTELGFMLASATEQMIEVLHTQNIKPYWNLSFNYRLLGAPGEFRDLKNNHNNYQITSWYQSPNKRYNNYLVLLGNNLKASESGGILTDKNYLDNSVYAGNRFLIPTHLGGTPYFPDYARSTNVTTGHKEKESVFLVRQQYDFGRKDSLVTDSTVIPLFYPRLRFENTFTYRKYSNQYVDYPSSGSIVNAPDSRYYDSLYGIKLSALHDTVSLTDSWKELSNDFSIYQFPDANNLQQYIKLGAELQLLKGTLKAGNYSFYNVIGHGEYRNRTNNGKWDINASGRLYLAGLNIGDYHAFISLERLFNKQLGTLQVGFENINRSPSFIYNQRSYFYLDVPKTFSKENTTHLFASYFIPRFGVQLRGDYYLVSNYLYLSGYRNLQQENAIFNLVRVSGFKSFKLNRRWNLHSDVYVQQKAGGAAINVPLFYTRNRLAYEGVFFKNLNLSTGLEVRYHTPYKADNYSPVLGQFFYQDTLTINNRPEVDAFMNIRIRTFKAFLRLENLNAASLSGGFGFNNNNLAAPNYPMPGMVFRLGIYWTFIN